MDLVRAWLNGRNAREGNPTNDDLKAQLLGLYKNNKNNLDKSFLEVDTVTSLLTCERIKSWANSHDLHRQFETVPPELDLICEINRSATLLFAVLIMHDLEYLTFSFISNEYSDQGLPDFDMRKVDLDPEEESRLKLGLGKVAPILTPQRHQEFSSHVVLPFKRRGKTGRNGAFGKIYKLEIAPGHLDGAVKVAYSSVFQLLGTYANGLKSQKSRSVAAAEKEVDLDRLYDEQTWKVIYREIETLKSRQHPNIVPLWASYTLTTEESEVDVRSLHLVMPWAELNLAQWMRMPKPSLWLQAPLSPGRRSFLYQSIFDLISGLSFLHRERDGFITAHHDLKPSNVLIIDQKLMIADFGRSHLRPLSGGSQTAGSSGLGTYDYHPPEYWTDDGVRAEIKHGRPFDSWSLGCIVTELATLLLYDWPFRGVAKFEGRRRDAAPKERPKLADKHDPDSSFHNNFTTVKTWIAELRNKDTSPKFAVLLNMAMQLMALSPNDRLYVWEAELDLYDLLFPDADPEERRHKIISCVQAPPRNSSGEVDLPSGIETPIDRASRKGDTERQKELQARGWPASSFNAHISHQTIPRSQMKRSTREADVELLRAAAHGDDQQVHRLLEDGADVTFADESGRSALYEAVRKRHVAVVDRLLETHHPKILQQKDNKWQDTPLHKAASEGRAEIVERILAYDPDIEARQREGKTPLYVAAEWGHIPVVKILLKHGARIFTQRDTGGTPLHALTYVEHGEPYPGMVSILQLLLREADARRCLEHRNVHGDTPFYLAVTRSNLVCARLLRDAGASIHVSNVGGVNVLHWAAQNGLGELLREIVGSFGRDEILARNDHGHTPIDVAKMRRNFIELEMLQRRLDAC